MGTALASHPNRKNAEIHTKPSLVYVIHPTSHERVMTNLIKFLERIRGAFTAAPTKELPVSQIPHAAPTTEKPNPKAIPKLAYP